MMQPPSPPATPPSAFVAPAQPGVGVVVRPDTVTVGDPFTLTITVEGAPGMLVRFPAEPDSATTIALRAPAELPMEGERMPNGRMRWRARYPLAAWDVGALVVPIGPVTIGTRTVPVFARVVVASVLPADTAQRVPHGARPPVPWPTPWWWAWLIAALVVAAMAALLSVAARWRRRRPVVRVRAIDAARAELDALDAPASLAVGESVHALDGSADVLRRYLRRRWAETTLLEGYGLDAGLTTGELVQRLRDVGWPATARVHALLDAIDAVRFAPGTIDAARARAFTDAVRPLLEEMEAALVTRESAAPGRKAA
ncbi:MAG: BatD family protein [Gemmatimonadaceae bacterium]|jgi:hypothetical protein|nr:BatD family protein [Gemmatimonadaceae bacterium]